MTGEYEAYAARRLDLERNTFDSMVISGAQNAFSGIRINDERNAHVSIGIKVEENGFPDRNHW